MNQEKSVGLGRYYMTVGQDSFMYVLRYSWEECDRYGNWRHRTSAVQNLSINYDKAVKKAREIVDSYDKIYPLSICERISLNKIKREKKDEVKMPFGKYSGQYIADIEDIDYLYWTLFYMQSRKHYRRQYNAILIKLGITEEEYNTYMKEERKEKERREQDRQVRYDAIKNATIHYGEVGNIYKDVVVICKKVHHNENIRSIYSYRTMLRFQVKDNHNQSLYWYASRHQYDYKEGQEYVIQFKVKKHNGKDGWSNTIIKNVKKI